MSMSEVISAFDHGTLVDRIKDQITFRCNHCGKDIYGYCRFKQHLGGISGEVTPCVEVLEDVKVQMRNSIARTKIAHVNNSPQCKNEADVDVHGHAAPEDEDAKVHMINSSPRIKIGHVNNSTKSKNEASMDICDHGTVVDKQKGRVRCNYCAKEVSGSYYRLKQQLAGVRGDVLPCVEVPRNIKGTNEEALADEKESSSVKNLIQTCFVTRITSGYHTKLEISLCSGKQFAHQSTICAFRDAADYASRSSVSCTMIQMFGFSREWCVLCAYCNVFYLARSCYCPGQFGSIACAGLMQFGALKCRPLFSPFFHNPVASEYCVVVRQMTLFVQVPGVCMKSVKLCGNTINSCNWECTSS